MSMLYCIHVISMFASKTSMVKSTKSEWSVFLKPSWEVSWIYPWIYHRRNAVFGNIGTLFYDNSTLAHSVSLTFLR